MGSVGLAHDYITQKGGAERVFLAMHRIFPGASLTTTIINRRKTFAEFLNATVDVSFLNSFKVFRDDPQRALPFFPAAVNSMYIDADVALCSSSGWAHGFKTSGKKIVYCHNPPRWLYQREDYLKDRGTAPRVASQLLARPLRAWDKSVSSTVDLYLANSTSVRDRINAVYGIDAEIVFPPVTLDSQGPKKEVLVHREFYLTVSRSRGYKNLDVVCEAFRATPGRHLVVVGRPPISTYDAPGNVTFVRDLSDAEVRWLYANCIALIAVSREDFGLTPLEANIFGKPVIAPASGGYLDTVLFDRTGVEVHAVTPSCLNDSISRLEGMCFSSEEIREHASKYSLDNFRSQLEGIIDRVI